MKAIDVPPDVAASVTLPTPRELQEHYPMRAGAARLIAQTRADIAGILSGKDDRLLVVVGPCSIHDVEAALRYGRWIREIAPRYDGRLLLVMRAYVEKARTRLGWKGLLHDPRLDGSSRIDEGLALSRRLLVELNQLGVPVATEMLEPSTPAYLADTISWAAIGARTVESPVHRELASGLPCPVGFKNTTGGDVGVAVNAVVTARRAHQFLSIDGEGRAALAATTGNPDAHIILRGGTRPNFDALSIANAAAMLHANGLPSRLVVDCSHGNCEGDYRNQVGVARSLASQLDSGVIAGVMIESHLVEGRQAPSDVPRRAGQSLTDACLGPAATLEALDALSDRRRG